MWIKIWSIGLVALILMLGETASAQGPTEKPKIRASLKPPVSVEPAPELTGRPLSLTELEELALGHNPTIVAADARVRQEQGLTRQAGLYPNPTAGYLRTMPDQSGQSQSSGVFVSQEFVTKGKLRLATAAGQADIERSRCQLSAQKTRVLNDVRIRYYEVLGAQEALKTVTELEEVAAKGVDITNRLLKAGHGSRPDVLQAEIQLSNVRTALRDAQYRREAAWRQLTHVAGVHDMPPAPLLGKLDDDFPRLEFDQIKQQLITESPLLQAQNFEIKTAQYQLQLARAQAYPNLSVQVVAQRDSTLNFSSVSALVSVPVPIFNRNQGNILNMEALLTQQQKEYDRVVLASLDQLTISFRHYISQYSQAEKLRDEILPRSKENLDLTTKAYEAGEFDFPRVLSARQTHFHSVLAYIDTLTELRKSAIEIQGLQLTGGLNPTEVGTALQSQGGGAGLRGVLLQQQDMRGGASQNLPGALQAAER